MFASVVRMRRVMLLATLATLAAAPSPGAAETSATANGWCAVSAYRPVADTDRVPVRIETVGHPDGSTTYTFGCSSFDYFRFAPGLSQNFGASAWVGGYGYAGNGVLRAFLRVGASVSPKRYGSGFVFGINPFAAKASGGTSAGFTDTIVVPPTASAPNPGDPTTISLVARLTCVETGLYQVQWYTDSSVSASVSTPTGGEGVRFNTNLSFGRATCQPLSNEGFPKVIATTVGASLTLATGIDLTVATQYDIDSTIADQDAYTDATNTATFAVRAADGTPLVGASGTVYDGTTGAVPPLVSPTTTSTTTTTMTTTTLAGCETACGNGAVDAACGETCDCPATDDPVLAAYGCNGSAVVPAQAGCAICRECRIDAHICEAQSATTTTTVAGGSTTSTTGIGGPTTTTTLAPRGPCDGFSGPALGRCRLDVALDAPLCGADPVPAKFDRKLRARLQSVVVRLDKASASEGRKRARLLRKARGALQAVGRKAAAAGKSKRASKAITPGCANTLGRLVETVTGDLS